MRKLKELCAFLGPMYSIQIRDGAECICRQINESLEFEIVPLDGKMTIHLWQIKPHIELLAIYSEIRDEETLADALGYLSFTYQSLSTQIRVEREDSVR